MNRREFLKKSIQLSAAAYGLKHIPLFGFDPVADPAALSKDLVLVKNGAPGVMVQKAVAMLGGISRFVKKGDTVVIKPNIGWARRPEQAANTNPEVVAEIVKLCRVAGASKVKVFDHTCNEAKQCYHLSGIEQAAREAGASLSFIYPQKFKKIQIPKGKLLSSWEFYADVFDADVFINVPIAKHHSLSKITMGMKNIMGIIGGRRGEIHNHFDQKLTDLNMVIRPHLTILDAVRILLRNGPQGGNLNDVQTTNTIIAGIDPVAVDAFGATLFGLNGSDLGFLQEAHRAGLGEIDLKIMKIKTADLAVG